MQELNKELKLGHTSAYDPQAIFVRDMIIGQKRGIGLLEIFPHELSPVPTSLVDDYECLRKGTKYMYQDTSVTSQRG